jgi:hypothetical protein
VTVGAPALGGRRLNPLSRQRLTRTRRRSGPAKRGRYKAEAICEREGPLLGCCRI